MNVFLSGKCSVGSMSRFPKGWKKVVSMFFLGTVVCSFADAESSVDGTSRSPNILLILLDDLGYADLGCQGSPDIRTPNIDALAVSGIRFTDGYVPASVCGPSRASLMTGKCSAAFGLQGNGDAEVGIPLEHKNMAEYLKTAGYATQAIGKWHLGEHSPGQTPMARGFDEFLGMLGGSSFYFPFSEGGAKWNEQHHKTPQQRNDQVLGVGDYPPETYLTDLYTEEAIGFINAHSTSDTRHPTPFFIYLAYNAPHGPVQAPDQYMQRNLHVPDETRRKLAGAMTAVDDGIGTVIATLKERGLYENTLIVLLSDNGGPTKVNASLNTPLRGVKGDVWEGGVRVPFMAAWPEKIKPKQVMDTPVSSIDLLPTFLAAAGIKTDDSFDGMNILPWLLGETDTLSERDLFFWRGGRRAVRSGNMKLTNAQLGPKSELFNIVDNKKEDPAKKIQNPELHQTLTRKIEKWEAGWAPVIARDRK
jgi:arylsulfatase A-like enzyme